MNAIQSSRRVRFLPLIACLSMLYFFESAFAEHDPAEEKLSRALVEGSVQWLSVQDKDMLAWSFTSSRIPPLGAVILIPDQSETIGAVDVITPLRKQFVEQGFSVLVVSMPPSKDQAVQVEPLTPAAPAPTSDKTADEAQDQYAALAKDRFDAADKFMRAGNYMQTIWIGHGTGGYWLLKYFANKKPALATGADKSPWSGVVLISAYAPHSTQISTSLQQQVLAQIKFPILDIVALRDHRYVSDQAKERISIIQTAKEANFRQKFWEGVDFHFSGAQEELSYSIRLWARGQQKALNDKKES